MFFNSPQRIDLSLPQSYNRCSLAQLRGIASVMMSLFSQADSFHAVSMENIKIASFFELANLEVVAPINPRVPVEDQYYMVRFKHNRINTYINAIMGRNKPFALYLWQIQSWLSPRKMKSSNRVKPGMLDWMNADSKAFFTVFPFEYVRRSKHLLGIPKRFHGPNPMLDGFSWQRYRFAQDYMKNYMEQQNYLVKLQAMGRKVSANDLLKAVHHVDTAKALFLATIFEAKIDFTDENTGLIRRDWHYQSNQSSDNIEYFRNFSDIDWQVVLLWWSGIMGWLGNTYPRVFKVQPTKGQQQHTNPMELYARTTATMEKYVGLNAEEVEREPYTTILQQMEDIARNNEEMERLRKKH